MYEIWFFLSRSCLASIALWLSEAGFETLDALRVSVRSIVCVTNMMSYDSALAGSQNVCKPYQSIKKTRVPNSAKASSAFVAYIQSPCDCFENPVPTESLLVAVPWES